jgi:hypothetical protein
MTVEQSSTTACCSSSCCGGSASSISDVGTQARIPDVVRSHYGAIAELVLTENTARSCCGTSSCCTDQSGDTISEGLYLASELEGLPLKAALASEEVATKVYEIHILERWCRVSQETRAEEPK